jgi:hypothetical protein
MIIKTIQKEEKMSEEIRGWLQDRILVVSKEDDLTSVSKKVRDKIISDSKTKHPDIKEENIYISDITFRTPLQEYDEIWTYNNGKENFRNLHGEAGFALVRLKMVIERQMTICS